MHSDQISRPDIRKQPLLVLILLLGWAACTPALADAYKCRTPSGKIFISDTGCTGQDRLERVQSREVISLERQRQAHEVNSRTNAMLQGIEAENADYRESVRKQNEAIARADSQRLAAEATGIANENIGRQRDECNQLATSRNMPRSQRAALAEICAKPEPDNQRFNDCKDQLAKASSPSQRAMIASNCTGDANAGARVREASRPDPIPTPTPPTPIAVIKNCNGGSCTDQMGNRYNTTVGKTVRQDGKRCYQQGNAMYCN